MRRERDWANIKEIATQRGTCISKTGANHARAEADFLEHPDIVHYYTFNLPEGMGYLRTLNIGQDVYIDYVTPWHDTTQLKKFVSMVSKVRNIYMPKGCSPPEFESGEPYKEVKFAEVAYAIRQRVYCINTRSVVKLEK